jgi:predicted TIM-barrel fold metal-dependent hydrolase
MTGFRLSRREAIKSIGGAMVAGAFSVEPGGRACSSAGDEPPAEKPIIDTHVHLVNLRLSGVPELTAQDKKTSLAPFEEGTRAEGAMRLAKVIGEETKAAGVGQVLCMPRCEVSDKDPLGIKEVEALAALIRGPQLHPVGLAHPKRIDGDHLARVEEVLKRRKVKALKVYLGYLHYGPDNPGYRPYYKLAAEYEIPVIFHTGDTFSDKAKVKYAHPLQIDEVAVDFPETKFIIAHFGNPWITDAAEVVYKNKNVWADLSGILVGDEKYFAGLETAGVLSRTIKRIQQGIEFVESPEKFLYGSDWPLAPMRVYRDFVQRLIPEKHHQAVFHENAKTLFKL